MVDGNRNAKMNLPPVAAIGILALAIVQAGCDNHHESSISTEETTAGFNTIQLTDTNFRNEVIESEQPVLVDMWAPWCQPCIAMKPVIRELAEALAGEVKVAELNIAENPFIKEKYEVDRYPMLLVFADGAEVRRLVGTHTKSELMIEIDTVRKSFQVNGYWDSACSHSPIVLRDVQPTPSRNSIDKDSNSPDVYTNE